MRDSAGGITLADYLAMTEAEAAAWQAALIPLVRERIEHDQAMAVVASGAKAAFRG